MPGGVKLVGGTASSELILHSLPGSHQLPFVWFCSLFFFPEEKIQRFQPPKQLGNLGNQRNFLGNVPADIKMWIGPTLLPFIYRFALKINKIHFFMSAKQETVLTFRHKASHRVTFWQSHCFCFLLLLRFVGRLPELANPPERVSMAFALDWAAKDLLFVTHPEFFERKHIQDSF